MEKTLEAEMLEALERYDFPLLMSLDQVAQATGLGVQTLRRRVEDGSLACVRSAGSRRGSRVKFTRASVAAFIAGLE